MSVSIALMSKVAAGVVIAGAASYFGYTQMTGSCPFSCSGDSSAEAALASSSESSSCCPMDKSAGEDFEIVDAAMPAESKSSCSSGPCGSGSETVMVSGEMAAESCCGQCETAGACEVPCSEKAAMAACGEMTACSEKTECSEMTECSGGAMAVSNETEKSSDCGGCPMMEAERLANEAEDGAKAEVEEVASRN